MVIPEVKKALLTETDDRIDKIEKMYKRGSYIRRRKI